MSTLDKILAIWGAITTLASLVLGYLMFVYDDTPQTLEEAVAVLDRIANNVENLGQPYSQQQALQFAQSAQQVIQSATGAPAGETPFVLVAADGGGFVDIREDEALFMVVQGREISVGAPDVRSGSALLTFESKSGAWFSAGDSYDIDGLPCRIVYLGTTETSDGGEAARLRATCQTDRLGGEQSDAAND